VRQCKDCVFRNNQNICGIKDIDIYKVDYDDCWFYKNTLEEFNESEDEC
jgi:hypothetical protein